MRKGWILFLLILIQHHCHAQEADNGRVQFFYPNGQVSSEGLMRDGKPDGYWITYYVSGVIKSEGKRFNYLLDSTWNFYNQGGELTQSISYKMGEKNGYTLHYIYNNPTNPGQATITSRELYVNGKREGTSYYYYPGGELKQEIPYVNNQKHGLSRMFNRDSIVISILEYNANYLVNRELINRKDDEGMKQGTYREYFENGKLKKEEHYLDNELHGYFREFDDRGELLMVLRYERGKIKEEYDEDIRELLDMKSTFDEQGRLIFTGGYREGIPVGIHRFFDTTGVVINSFLYNVTGQKIGEGIIDEQGIRSGKWEDIYPGGAIRARGSYENNRRSGTWSFYFENGGLEQKGPYERGRYHGSWIWYYPNGNIWREESYFNGRQDGVYTEYDHAGIILTRGDYIQGEKDGEWLYQVGDHEERGKYVIGLREGDWKYYYPNGELKYEGSYFQGNPNKRHKYYYPGGILKEEQYYEIGIRQKNWKKYDELGNLTMTITYKNNVEIRINGSKIRLPESDVKLIQ